MVLDVNSKYENCTNCINLESNLIYEIDGNIFINNLNFRETSIYNIHNNDNSLYLNDNEVLYKINSDLSLTEKFRVKGADSIRIISNNVIKAFKRISRKELQHKFYNYEYKELWSHTADQ